MSDKPNTKRSWEEVTCKELADFYKSQEWLHLADEVERYAKLLTKHPTGWGKNDERTDDSRGD